MVEFDVTATLEGINFTPESELAEILQNVRTILTTPKYSVPLNRSFGLSVTALDDPLPAAQARLTAEIIAAVHQYEPRVRVVQVTYEGDTLEGVLRPKVRVVLVEQSQQPA